MAQYTVERTLDFAAATGKPMPEASRAVLFRRATAVAEHLQW